MPDFVNDACVGVHPAPLRILRPTEISPRPFDRADADVILRSSDHINFHVHRAYLSIASSFFDDMFSLPQTSDTHKDVQVIDVAEDSSTMNAILRMCYPVADRSISSFALLSSALRAALKYDMELAAELCKQSLRGYVHSQPLQVYAVACRVGDESIAKLAAANLFDSRDTILDQFVDELEEIPAGCYHRLLLYMRGDMERDEVESMTFCHPPPIPKSDILDGTTTHAAPAASLLADIDCSIFFAETEALAEVCIVTADGGQLRIPKAVIALVSPVLSEMYSQALDARKRCNEDDEQSLPIVQVEESTQIMSHLLRIWHPSIVPDAISVAMLSILLQAAMKYKMEKVVWFLRQQFNSLSASEPLRMYLLAVSHGWKGEASRAAEATLNQRFLDLQETYICELEVAPAGPYYRLLNYNRACGGAASLVGTSDLKLELGTHRCRYCGPTGSDHWRGEAHMQQVAKWLQDRPAPSALIAGLVATYTSGTYIIPNRNGVIASLSRFTNKAREIEAAIAKVSASFTTSKS